MRGVIDPYHRPYGHSGISVVDGAAVSASLGGNPALTIMVQAERSLSYWPDKGARDPRPSPGAAYVRLKPVAPSHPTALSEAFGALKLPLPGMPVVPPKGNCPRSNSRRL